VDILVNVAGADVVRPFLDTDEELWRWLIELNLIGVFRTTKAFLPGMVERGYGRIVNVASDAGRVGSSGEAVYSGAKGGVIAFTKTIAREVARHGVTANTVCPGPTDTPPLRKTLDQGGEKFITALTRAIPVGRLGLPEDVAVAVAMFASIEAGFITGQTLSVSGGMSMA
jgi:2-hydroxycyclohexanecarboxyl-CoA dehydrogenase